MRSIWFQAFLLAVVVTPAVAQVAGPRFEDLVQQFVFGNRRVRKSRRVG